MKLFFIQKIVFIQFLKCRQLIQKMGLNTNNTGRGIILFEVKKVNKIFGIDMNCSSLICIMTKYCQCFQKIRILSIQIHIFE